VLVEYITKKGEAFRRNIWRVVILVTVGLDKVSTVHEWKKNV